MLRPLDIPVGVQALEGVVVQRGTFTPISGCIQIVSFSPVLITQQEPNRNERKYN